MFNYPIAPKTRHKRGRRAAFTSMLATATIAAGLLTSSGAANAAATSGVLSAYPSFECYSNGTVVADRPQVNSDGRTVVWEPIFYVYTSGGWQIAATANPQAGVEPSSYPFSFGSWMLVNPVSFAGKPHHYYAVSDYIAAPGFTAVLPLANAFLGHSGGPAGGTNVCYTG